MRLQTHAEAQTHRAPFPNGPTVTPIFGGEPDGPAVGLVQLALAAGTGMPPHRHDGSDIIVTPISGSVRVTKGEEVLDVRVGDSILITEDETVTLANPDDVDACVLIAAGPADFIAKARNLPPA